MFVVAEPAPIVSCLVSMRPRASRVDVERVERAPVLRRGHGLELAEGARGLDRGDRVLGGPREEVRAEAGARVAGECEGVPARGHDGSDQRVRIVLVGHGVRAVHALARHPEVVVEAARDAARDRTAPARVLPSNESQSMNVLGCVAGAPWAFRRRRISCCASSHAFG
jgi:hypothetical protein